MSVLMCSAIYTLKILRGYQRKYLEFVYVRLTRCRRQTSVCCDAWTRFLLYTTEKVRHNVSVKRVGVLDLGSFSCLETAHLVILYLDLLF